MLAHLVYRVLRKALFRVDAERAHGLAFAAAKMAQRVGLPVVRSVYRSRVDGLGQRLWGHNFETPIGLAAGFDKNAELIELWSALGFGFCEVGSVSARPSPGNPKPRAFRLPGDEALINRMGLNNDGALEVAERLAHASSRSIPVGINIAKTHDPSLEGASAIEDFCQSFRVLAPQADFITLNVSCPNTREGKTFEDPEGFAALMAAIRSERDELSDGVAVLVKLSPPPGLPAAIPGSVDQLVDIALEHGIDGFVACNTASDREGLGTSADEIERIGRGGLSGRPLAARSTRLVAHLYRRLRGEVPIVGVGGVSTLADATEKIEAGASLLQLYTGLVYRGPGLPGRLAKGLAGWLAQAGYDSIDAAVGSRAEEL